MGTAAWGGSGEGKCFPCHGLSWWWPILYFPSQLHQTAVRPKLSAVSVIRLFVRTRQPSATLASPLVCMRETTSKADDVSFILELISKVAEAHPAADANNVNLIGTSNGAAIIYRLLIATGVDRPFHRVFPMVSSMISVQWRDGSFWKSTDTMSNDYTIQTIPEFSDDFEYYHFHGTNDGTIAYEGKCPGPPFLGEDVCVIPSQQTD